MLYIIIQLEHLIFALGNEALFKNASGDYNIAIGYAAMQSASNTNSNFSIAIGYNALRNNDYPSGDISIGSNSMSNSSNNTNANVAIGANTLYYTKGANNIAIGQQALFSSSGVTDSSNIALGTRALRNFSDGINNIAIGVDSAISIKNGNNNIAIGTLSLTSASGSSHNIFMGYGSGSGLLIGQGNLGFGYSALDSLQDGDYNIGIGYNSGVSLVTGNRNVYIGWNSSQTTESDTVYIGTTTQLKLKIDSSRSASFYNNLSVAGSIFGRSSSATVSSSAVISSSATISSSTVLAQSVVNGIYSTDTGTVTSNMIANETITNTDISLNAQITPNKLSASSITIAGNIVGLGESLNSIGVQYLSASSITIGSTLIGLGETKTVFDGLSKIISSSFVGALIGNASTASSINWAAGITEKPTTLSGYGITDALDTSSTAQTKSGNLNLNGNLIVDTNVLYVDSNTNNVGIGLTSISAAHKLAVNGTASISRVDTQTLYFTSNASAIAQFQFYNDIHVRGNNQLSFVNTNGASAIILATTTPYLSIRTGELGEIRFTKSTSSDQFSNFRVYADSTNFTGSVRINNTNAAATALHVSGGVYVTEDINILGSTRMATTASVLGDFYLNKSWNVLTTACPTYTLSGAYYRILGDKVEFKGNVVRNTGTTTNGDNIAVLPTTIRPNATVRLPVALSASPYIGHVRIVFSSGLLDLQFPGTVTGTASVHLDGVSFYMTNNSTANS